MTEYQGIVFEKLLSPLIILLAIAIIYFVFNNSQTFWNRLLASSHSIIVIAGIIYVIIVCRYTSASSFAPHTVIFSNILAVAAIFGFVSVLYFKGNKTIHLLLFPFLLCMAYVWHVGGKAITHTMV